MDTFSGAGGAGGTAINLQSRDDAKREGGRIDGTATINTAATSHDFSVTTLAL